MPMRKGMEADWKTKNIKVTVERSSMDDISAGGLVEFVLKVEQNRFVPGGEYPEAVQAAIK